MGYGSQIHHMIFITFLFISLQRSHILVAEGLLLDKAVDFRVRGLQQLFFMDETVGNNNQVEDVTGQDDKLTKRRVPLTGVANCFPPSPSPNIRAEASVPAPPKVAHFHPPPTL
ncbi:hypothetical protein GOBAR_AA16204 [Gossypium barbadense]|uniref:Uncharacterized protein n=1 Tax=Gossypium barbadense TaxID=3634 RepID=A0A2P5XM86_GOSBA|nr:hypothetical protein GOBAR_AA16204 [Gossypium barbadense]